MCEPSGSGWTLTSKVALGSPGKEQMAPSAAQRRFENSSHPERPMGQRISSVDSGPPSSRCARVLGEMSRFDQQTLFGNLRPKGCTKKCWFGRFSTNMGAYFQELKLALHVFGYVKPGSSGKEPRRPAFATGPQKRAQLTWEPRGKKRPFGQPSCWLKISTKD